MACPKQYNNFRRSSCPSVEDVPLSTPSSSPSSSPRTARSGSVISAKGTVSDPLSMDEIDTISQSSTISFDSTTCTNLALAEYNKTLSAKKLLQRSEVVLRQEEGVKEAILQNNRALEHGIEAVRSHRAKTNEVRDSNTQLRKRVSVLEKEKKELQLAKEDLEKSDKEKGGGSARLKIDQAAAAVKSLKEQLADKDRQLETTQSKIDHALRIGTAETTSLKSKLRESELKIGMLEEERNTLKLALQAQEAAFSESDTGDYMRQEAELQDYKNQVALLTCQDAVVRRLLDSLEEHMETGSTPNHSFLQKKISFLSAFMQTPPSLPEPHYVERTEHYPPTSAQYVDRSYAASLAASHSEQPPQHNYPEFEYRPY